VVVSDKYALGKPLESLTQTLMTVCRVDLVQRGRVILETDTHEKIWLDYDGARQAVSARNSAIHYSVCG
jgi:YD repeat-containing protein